MLNDSIGDGDIDFGHDRLVAHSNKRGSLDYYYYYYYWTYIKMAIICLNNSA